MPAPQQFQSCKIRVLGRLWTLIKKQPPHPRHDGLCWYEERKILLAPSGLRTRRLELLAHELLHARFRDLDEESVLEAGKLIGRLHRKVKNYGFKLFGEPLPALSPSKAARKPTRRKKGARRGAPSRRKNRD